VANVHAEKFEAAGMGTSANTGRNADSARSVAD
jgi:hypothetical protein